MERVGGKAHILARSGKWIQMLSLAALVVFAALTLHDMQTAEGTGLYLSFKMGAQDRFGYDLLVDGIGMLLLLALLLLPCFGLKRLQPAPVLRFASACLAFLPVMSTAALIHLLDGTDRIALRQAVVEGQLLLALREGLAGLLPILAVGVPVLMLALGMQKTGSTQGEAQIGEERTEAGGKVRAHRGDTGAGPGQQETEQAGAKGSQAKIKGRDWRLGRSVWVLALGLVVIGVLFPLLTETCVYLMVYMLLIRAFSLWEKLWEENPGRNGWGWILFGGFWLRAIERMLDVMRVYHL